MLIFVEPAVELMVAVAVRGRRPGETSCLYLHVSGPHTWCLVMLIFVEPAV